MHIFIFGTHYSLTCTLCKELNYKPEKARTRTVGQLESCTFDVSFVPLAPKLRPGESFKYLKLEIQIFLRQNM